MSKKVIKMNESALHSLIKESISRVISEMDEGLVIENEARFLPHLKRTYENLRREYEHWQYANYKPQGMDNAISAIIDAMHSVEDVINDIEPSDNIPTWEDPQQY